MNFSSEKKLESYVDSGPLTPVRLLVVALCTAVTILEGFDTQSIAFVAPSISKDWGVSSTSFGPVFAASILGLMAGSLIGGYLGDRIGRKLTLTGSVAIVGISMVSASQVQTIDQLMIVRIITGLGIGATTPVATALVSEFVPKRLRATMITLMVSGYSLGAVLGGGASALLIEDLGWRSLLFIGGAMPLVLSFGLLGFLPESPMILMRRAKSENSLQRLLTRINPEYRGDQAVKTVELRETVSRWEELFTSVYLMRTIVVWILVILGMASMYFLVNWLPTILTISGFDSSSAILGGVLFSAGGMFGAVLLSYLIDKTGRNYPMTVLYCCSALFLVALPLSALHAPALMMPLVFLAGVSVIGTFNILPAMVSSVYAVHLKAKGIGSAYAFGRLGTVVGLVVGGQMLSESRGIVVVFGALAVIALLGAAVFTIFVSSFKKSA